MNITTNNNNLDTLGRSFTLGFFQTEEGFKELRARWASLVNSERKHELSSSAHLLYAILRGKDYRKGFGDTTSANKLANGSHKHDGLRLALMGLFDHRGQLRNHLGELFGDLISPQFYAQVSPMLIKSNECFANELPSSYRVGDRG